MNGEKALAELETLFMALADKTRLRLLNLMRDDEICVCFFTEVLGESQPKISRHLAYLRNAGLVEARRDGKWMHYRIVAPANGLTGQILADTLEQLAAQPDLQREYDTLIHVCCSAEVPVTIARAPKPDTFTESQISPAPKHELETFLL